MAWVAVGTSVVGGLAGYLGSKQKRNAQQDQTDAYNKYLGNYQQGQNTYLDYLKDAPNPTETSSGTGSSFTRNNQTTDQTSNPFVTSEFSPLVGMARSIIQQRLAGPSSLPAGYAQNQIRNINAASQGASTAAQNQAARFGLSGPQAMALTTPNEINRTNQIATAQSQLPLLERQMRNEDLGLASDMANMFGKGQQSHGTTSGTSSTSSSSNNMSTGSKPFASMASFLPPSPNMPNPQGGTANDVFAGVGGAMDGGLGDLLSQLLKKKNGVSSYVPGDIAKFGEIK